MDAFLREGGAVKRDFVYTAGKCVFGFCAERCADPDFVVVHDRWFIGSAAFFPSANGMFAVNPRTDAVRFAKLIGDGDVVPVFAVGESGVAHPAMRGAGGGMKGEACVCEFAVADEAERPVFVVGLEAGVSRAAFADDGC